MEKAAFAAFSSFCGALFDVFTDNAGEIFRMLSEIKLRGAWRKIRSKIGIRSEKVAIKRHSPWYVKFVGYGLMMGVAGAVAWYLVDNSYKITGFNREEATAQIAKLTADGERLKREFELTKALLNEREGQLKIEKSAQSELAKNVAQTQEENSGLKEDLAFLRNIMSSGNVPEGLTIANLKIEADALPNEYRYRMLLTQGGQRKHDFKGKVQVVARVQSGNQQIAISFPTDAEVRGQGGEIEFRYYQKVDGRFRIPEGAVLKSIQVRVLAIPGYEVRSQKGVNL
jgi:hypothetical protein